MKCIRCGTELKKEAKFCKSCGFEVKSMPPQVEIRTVIENGWNGSARDTKELIENLLQFVRNCEKKEAEIERLEKLNHSLNVTLEEKENIIRKKNNDIITMQNALEKSKASEIELRKELAELKKGTVVPKEEKIEKEITECPKCKAKVDSHTIFCGECGTKIR